jgi:superfamily II DNA/RNA helicase
LEKRGYSVGSLHGDMDQLTRTKTLDGFRANDIKLLVASDVAARGLDIPDVSHVFNFDVPIHAEDYVHRIGRCGRAGRDGWAFTLVSPADDKYLSAILELTGDKLEYVAGETKFDEKSSKSRGRSAKKSDGAEKKPRAAKSKKPAEDNQIEEVKAQSEEKPKREPRGKSGRSQDDGPTPKGLGDHVPAFLLQSAALNN